MLDPHISNIYNIILSIICGIFIFLAIMPLINRQSNIVMNKNDVN